jgi:hypothetical protein
MPAEPGAAADLQNRVSRSSEADVQAVEQAIKPQLELT